MTTYRCIVCKDERWVCENHPLRAWGYGDGCCGGAGMPCKECNPCDRDHPPAMPPGMVEVWSINQPPEGQP